LIRYKDAGSSTRSQIQKKTFVDFVFSIYYRIFVLKY
jgi:hypothetical protein